MDNEIMVSILCTVYNHEKFLRKCLDGFVNQKTDFKFEIVIHDDNSTDDSKQIIREYEKLYPDLFIAVYSNENQFSKGIGIMPDILFPRAHGKYIAVCEGDDYWISEDKLQLQYNYMETHPECSMCTHNSIFHDLSGVKKDRLFNKWKEVHPLSDEEVFFEGNVHTSSYFIRREYFRCPVEMKSQYWFSDYVRLTYSYSCGSVVALPQIMSVYNFNNPSGVMYNNRAGGVDLLNKKRLDVISYLQEFNIFTNKRFEKVIDLRIKRTEFEVLVNSHNQIIKTTDNKKEAIELAKSIRYHSNFHKYLSSCSLLERLKSYYAYTGYHIYPIWKYIWEKYSK